MNILLVQLERIYNPQKSAKVHNSKNEKVKEFEKLVDNYFRENKMPSFYAEKLNVTANYLNKICNKEAGKTAGDIIRKRIIIEAQRFLHYTNLSINEVAHDLGFENASYFITFLRNKHMLLLNNLEKMQVIKLSNMKSANTLIKFILILFIKNSFAQTSQKSFEVIGKIAIETPHEKQTDFYKWYYDAKFYEKARNTKTFECLQIQYKCDTAFVEAWLYKPVKESKKLPIIIYNRGGMGNFGNLEETNLVDFYKMAERGYVVIASKTRFAGKYGKYDQHGGVDVDDIVNLKTIYENLTYVDTSNVFMYGFSRGGQNTYQASLKMKLNAMVVTAGTSDWLSRINERKEFVDGWTDEDSTLNYLGFAKVFPNWKTDSIQILKIVLPFIGLTK